MDENNLKNSAGSDNWMFRSAEDTYKIGRKLGLFDDEFVNKVNEIKKEQEDAANERKIRKVI